MASQTVAHASSNVVRVAFGTRVSRNVSQSDPMGGGGNVIAFRAKVDLGCLAAWYFRGCWDEDNMADWEHFKSIRPEPDLQAQFAAIEHYYGYRPTGPAAA